MPIFDTPQPIPVTIELGAGDVRITASDRADTVVEVRPTDESDASDVQAAQQTQVDFANGTLQVRAPKHRPFDWSRKTRSVAVSVELPAGSHVELDAQLGDVRATGRLGKCVIKTAAGQVQADRTGPLRLDTSAGHVTVNQIQGDAEITTGAGRVRVGEIDGAAVIKNSNGHTDVGTVTGELRVKSANGDISVDHAASGVDAKTANGSVRVGETGTGTVVVKTSMGDLEVGIGAGIAAWLDVHTGFGRVHNTLNESAPAADQSGKTVEVRAHTTFGDITIRRS